MHEKNIFLTLTYSDENLKSPKLIENDVVAFLKRLREHIYQETVKKVYGPDYWSKMSRPERKDFRKKNQFEQTRVGVFYTGEYGEKTKRPHWHLIIFNYEPDDRVPKYRHDSGDEVFTSPTIDRLWKSGNTEYGPVNADTAGYCARYSAKKLVHGLDGEHEYEPVSKKSSKHAIGKTWLEKNWPDVFSHGRLVLPDGTEIPIPRYYEKWLEKHRPKDWADYVSRIKLQKMERAKARANAETAEWWAAFDRRYLGKATPLTRNQVRDYLVKKKYKELEAYLKL